MSSSCSFGNKNCPTTMFCNPARLYTSHFTRTPGLVGTPDFSGDLGVAYAQQALLAYNGEGYLQNVNRFRTAENMYPTLTYSQIRCGGGVEFLNGMQGKSWDSTSCGQVDSAYRAPTRTTPPPINGMVADGVFMGYATPFSAAPYNPSVAM